MGIFNGMKKVVKFTTVTAPLNIIGWNHNKRMFNTIRTYFTRSVNPPCPMCDSGVMVCVKTLGTVPSATKASEPLHSWGCTGCDFGLLEIDNKKRVREVVTRMRWTRAKQAFTQVEQDERLRIARTHRIASRIFFVMAAVIFANCIRFIVTGEPVMMTLNWASVTLMFWVSGMKRSYRAWQVAEGHLFEEGAFWYWFKNASWLI